MYFDRSATQSPAKRGGSGGMHRPSNAAWVLPQAVQGALFRALVDGGADAMVAYNAEEGTKSMVSEAVATQVQPILVEMRQMFAAQERRFAALERRFDALEQRFDAQERKLDALTAEVQRVNEVVGVKLDGLRREMRLIWGALGISLTVWLVVLGYLLTN